MANASIIVDFNGVTGTGPFTFNYSADVSLDEELAPTINGPNGTFFTIYDIPGFLGASAPAGWFFSAQFTGLTATGTAPADSPSIINVTFVYTGATAAGPFTVSGFQVLDSFNTTQVGTFTGQATKDTGPQNGTIDGNIGFTTVPGSPEPASLILIGSGLVALAFARKRLSR